MDDHERDVTEQTGAGDYGGTPDPEETGAAEQAPAGGDEGAAGADEGAAGADEGAAGGGGRERHGEFERGGDGSEG